MPVLQVLDDWLRSKPHSDFYTTFEDYTDTICKYYGIPALSMRNALHALVQLGKPGFRHADLWADDLHPNEVGHAFLAYIVLDYFSLMLKQTQLTAADVRRYVPPKRLIPPMFSQNHHHKGLCGRGHALTKQVPTELPPMQCQPVQTCHICR
jgi:hypothetical protein